MAIQEHKPAVPHAAPLTVRRRLYVPIRLIAGFVTLLTLIILITVFTLHELQATEARLEDLASNHMSRLELSKVMHTAARERTLTLVKLTQTQDAFDRDELIMQFNALAVTFGEARQKFLALPIGAEERDMLARQATLTHQAIPIQAQVIALTESERFTEATTILVEQAIPAQSAVLDMLSRLDIHIRQTTQSAMTEARRAHHAARRLLVVLGSSAVLLGLLVAITVILQTLRFNRERERMATHDSLTGLPNRFLLMDRLEQAIVRAHRHKTQIGVLFIDLDGFKAVNDSYGHDAGDSLLQEVARRLRATVRSGDIMARLGGDEFIVAMLDAHQFVDIQAVVTKLSEEINRPFSVAGHECHLSCSIGISLYPQHADDPWTLLKFADMAMYQAKENGKNRFQQYDPGRQSAAGH